MNIGKRRRWVAILRVAAALLFVTSFLLLTGTAFIQFQAVDEVALGIALAAWSGFFASMWGLVPALCLLGIAEFLERGGPD